ncbi:MULTISPECIES: AI-2E family transporter [Halorussus]|uniref:AI-2E family transporter n=1 Tax=Halorussus TaxID=1070314 RepID=UPI000E217C76|nr:MULTISPECIES: AI-2E family transporter [Halorussus]NHN59457.1 AI-2E family transporter [Halorussus sp. JP-T4]
MVGGLDFDRGRLAWWLVGLALGAAVLYVVYSFVGTFVFGVFIYYATRPVYRRLRRRVRPPSLAAATALFALALPVLLLMTYTAAIALQEFDKIARRTDITGLQETIEPYIGVSSLALRPDELLANPDPALLQDIGRSALEYVGFIGNGLLHLFVMIAIAFYLLRDDHRLSRFFRRQFGDEGGVVESYVRAVDRDFNSIFFGNILNALLTGTIGAASYNVLNMIAPTELVVPYPTLLGLLTGAASLIPIVGMKLVYFPVSAYLGLETAVADPTFLWFPALFFMVSFVVVDTIPDLVLRPYVSGRNLHVGLVMLAYIFGPLLFGWYGIFLGPMLLVLVVHFVRIVLPELVAGEPIRPWAVDPTYLFDPEPTDTHPANEVGVDGGEPVDDGAADASDARDDDEAPAGDDFASDETDSDGPTRRPSDG